jgi:hypothetical protein
MTIRATVHDFAPAAFRRTLDRTRQPEEAAHTTTVLDNCADGILALDYALSFAGFGYEARQLVLSIVGLLGGGGSTLEVFDGDLAKHVQCSDRTIRRWRAAHLKESKARRFSLLEIVEGEYDAAHRCYGKTSYRFTAPDYVDAVVNGARASDLYERDRRAAIEQTAEVHYADIPDAPPRRRNRKPRRAPAARVEQAFVNAARSVEKGKLALDELADDSRAALLESSQGEELRQTLLKLQADIAEVLENFSQENLPQNAESEEVDRGYRTNCPVPPAVSGIPVGEQAAACAEHMAAWKEIERRAAGAPHVVSREIPLLSSPNSDEELEAEAIRAEGCRELR